METPHIPIHENNISSGQLSRPGTRVLRGDIETNLDGETKVQDVLTLSKKEIDDLEAAATEAGREVLRIGNATDIEELATFSELVNSGEAVCLIPAASEGSKLLNAVVAAQKAMEAGIQPHRLLFEDDQDDQSDIAPNLGSILS